MNIYEKYSNMTPGKYWSLPAGKKHLIDDYLENKDYIPMIKMDGYWARVIVWNDQVLIQSRGISKSTGTYGTYTEQVPDIVNELKTLPNGTVILGELAFKDLTKNANQVGSILRSNPARAIKLQEERGKLMLFVFDVLAFDGEDFLDLPFEERLEKFPSDMNFNLIQPVKRVEPGKGKELLSEVWDKGGEGIILIKKNLPYNIGGARAWHSIKVKRSLPELEGKVIGVIEPTKVYEGKELDTWPYWEDGEGHLFIKDRFLKGEYIPKPYTPITSPYFNGRMSGIIVKCEGRIINISSGITDEDGYFLASARAAEMIRDGELYAVFTGMELTETSVRHPSLIRLRDDM